MPLTLTQHTSAPHHLATPYHAARHPAARRIAARLLVVVLLAGTATFSGARTQDSADVPTTIAQTSNAPMAGVPIRWRARPNVSRYRLQLALDSGFNDIVFDRAVEGNTYAVTELPPGRYYWRVAPATTETEAYTTVGVITVAESSAAALLAQPTPNASPTETSVEIPTETPRPEPTMPEASAERATTVDRPATAADVNLEARPAPATGAVLMPRLNAGWLTAIGEIVSLVADDATSSGALKTTLLAANAEGSIFSLDANRGVALWTARYDAARRGGETFDRTRVGSFAPLIVGNLAVNSAAQNSSSSIQNRGVLVRYAGGLRLLDMSSGREIWRAALDGIPVAGAISNADSTSRLLITTHDPDRLQVINSATGAIERESRLSARPIGSPLAISDSADGEMLVALENGALLFFKPQGDDAPREVRLDTRATTPPLIIGNNTSKRLLIGTQRGLLALNLPDLSPAWRIATEGEAPRGILAGKDVDGDGMLEAAMLTRGGRVALVDAGRGVIKWVADNAPDAGTVAFADVNRDGVLDVLVAAGSVFANGYSGRDGSLIFSTNTEALQNGNTNKTPKADNSISPLRTLIVISTNDAARDGQPGATDSLLLIGADSAGVGVRGVPLSNLSSGTTAR